MPMQPLTGPKLAARRRHWGKVRGVMDEFSKQYIHENLRIKDVTKETFLSASTVTRFFHRGRGNGTKGYSWLHGPRGTTIFAIAEALDMEIKVVKRPSPAHIPVARYKPHKVRDTVAV